VGPKAQDTIPLGEIAQENQWEKLTGQGVKKSIEEKRKERTRKMPV